MAIASTPINFIVQTGNRQVYLSWNIVSGATSYSVQRSLDGVNYTVVSTPTLTNYLDTTVSIGTQYYYQVASVNASGTSSYTAAQSVVPAPTSEMSLGALRLRSQQKADMVNSNFVDTSEWNFFINQSVLELYNLLITCYEDYYLAPPVLFTTNGSTYMYPLPDGATTFLADQTFAPVVAPPFYKLMGVDLSIQSSANGFVTVNKFTFQDRNRFVYPNTASTIYGVFNLQYRVLGNNIQFIPTPSGNQQIRLWYIPRLPLLLQDTDLTNTGISGWLQYVIVRAAIYALTKEESDTSALTQELAFLKTTIEETAMNRDAGQPDRITDVRSNGWWGPNYGGGMGTIGGF